MIYKMRYIFKGTRDKGHEITECHGNYESYEFLQENEGQAVPDYEVMDIEPPDFPETEYLNFNKYNKEMRNRAKADTAYTDLPIFDNVNADDKGTEAEFPYKDAVWIEKNEPSYEPDLENGQFPLVGTELANFLNFDIDCFINGGYQLLWVYDSEKERECIAGWKKTVGFDLSKLWIRQAVNAFSIFGNSSDDYRVNDSIPFFIRMFGCSFINKEKWEYDLAEVQKIKDLQKRLRVFCNKVFFPKDEYDERSHLQRYCQEIKELSKKELKNFIPKDWYIPASLEEALATECYAMIKANANLFICENCGLYTVSKDKRSGLCSRLYYDGTMYDYNDYVFKEYRYICKQDKYQRDAFTHRNADIIETITEHERKRLYNHDALNIDLKKKIIDITVRDGLVEDFKNIVQKHKERYKERVCNAETDEVIIQIGNEYAELIVREMNDAMVKRMGEHSRRYKFEKKKNKQVKSIKGNIYK